MKIVSDTFNGHPDGARLADFIALVDKTRAEVGAVNARITGWNKSTVTWLQSVASPTIDDHTIWTVLTAVIE